MSMVNLRVPSGDLKMLRETLCAAQTALGLMPRPLGWTDRADRERLGRLIHQIDEHRPLGPDGSHGDLHTPTCGCEGHAT